MAKIKSLEEKTNKILLKYPELTFEKMFDLYINQFYGYENFKKTYGLPYNQTEHLLDFYKIKKRTIKDSASLKKTIEKRNKTIFDIYGVDNASKSIIIKEKKKETFIKNYGVDNIWKTKEYQIKLHEIMLEKYGKKSLGGTGPNQNSFGWKTITDEQKKIRRKKTSEGTSRYWNSLTDEQKTEIIQKRCREIVAHYSSSLESKIMTGLQNLEIKFKQQFWVNQKSYDFRIKESKILIEVNGDFWHANPKIYKENDLLNHPEKAKLAKEIWFQDEKKKENAEKYGYKVVYIWEAELKNLDQPDVMKLIIERIYED